MGWCIRLCYRGTFRTSHFGIIGNLPKSIVVIVFLGVGGDFSPWTDTPIAASCNLLRVSPTLVPSLSPYDNTSRVPNHYRRQSSRFTKPPNRTSPFDSSDSSTPPNSSKENHNIYITEPPLPSSPPTPPPWKEIMGGGRVKGRGTDAWLG